MVCLCLLLQLCRWLARSNPTVPVAVGCDAVCCCPPCTHEVSLQQQVTELAPGFGLQHAVHIVSLEGALPHNRSLWGVFCIGMGWGMDAMA